MVFWKKDKKSDTASDAPKDAGAGGMPAPSEERPATGSFARETPAGGGKDPSGAEAAASGESAPSVTPIDATMTEAKVIEAIRTCYDPEIPVNIYELGLIYEVDVKPSGEVAVKMTLTSPMCPVAGTLPHEVEAKVAGVKGVKSAHVDVVWDPPWTPEKMSEAAKLQLGML